MPDKITVNANFFIGLLSKINYTRLPLPPAMPASKNGRLLKNQG